MKSKRSVIFSKNCFQENSKIFVRDGVLPYHQAMCLIMIMIEKKNEKEGILLT